MLLQRERGARFLNAAAAILTVVAAGCATVPPCPAKGGPAWSELTSENFVLRSDLSVDDATEVLRSLEESRAGMLAGFWRRDQGPSGRIQAVALSSWGETTTLIGDYKAGVHFRRPPFPPTLIVGRSPDSQSTAKHELAHDLARYFLPVQPPWYAEGIATFLQTIRYDRSGHRSHLGEVAVDRYAYFKYGGTPLPFDQLMGPVPSEPVQTSAFYATAWLLMHYLCNQRPQGLEHLQERLGRLEPGAQAFRAEFPDLAGDGLSTILMRYAGGGQYVVVNREVAPWSGQPRVRTMTDSEVHGVRAFLHWSLRAAGAADTDALVRAEVDEALRSEVPSLDALAIAFYTAGAPSHLSRAALAARAVRTHPDAWMTWLMAADAHAGGASAARAELYRGLKLAPEEPEILLRLARAAAEENQWDDVLALSSRLRGDGAVHREAWALHVAALFETGHCAEGARWTAALKTYLALPDDRFLDELKRRSRCGSQGQPTPPG